jgi:FMN reductase
VGLTSSITYDGTLNVPEPNKPLVVGIGGGASENSSTEQALDLALDEVRRDGARTCKFGAEEIGRLPHYLTPAAQTSTGAREMVDMIRQARGLVIASPAYHGSISGVVKNALDYIEETARDARPYLTDLPVGLIAIAAGNQGATGALIAMRTIVHSLRGWPTPFGATINSSSGLFRDGRCIYSDAEEQIRRVGAQVARFTQWVVAD